MYIKFECCNFNIHWDLLWTKSYCKKTAKIVFCWLWPLERSKGQVTLTLHNLILWVIYISNVNVVTSIFTEICSGQNWKIFFVFCNLWPWKRSKGHVTLTLHNFELWVICIQSLKYVTSIFTEIWSGQDLDRPPARRRRPPQAITITTQSFDCGLKT